MKAATAAATAPPLAAACAAGYARLAAWSELLDEINVFPVADGDTGRNLCISMAPLREMEALGADHTERRLIRAATGNSGNIAAAFLTPFLQTASRESLTTASAAGAAHARAAIGAPVAGTMLDVFDTLAERLAADNGQGGPFTERLLPPLAQAVADTTAKLPALARADLIDAGALAMYLFFEGFFSNIDGLTPKVGPLPARFGDLSRRRPRIGRAPGDAASSQPVCVNAVVTPAPGRTMATLRRGLETLGDSVVLLGDGEGLKVHLHTDDLEAASDRLAGMGTIESLSGEPLYDDALLADPLPPGPVHIMTDAAGSLSRRLARPLGVTLLDSFVVGPGGAVPETLLDPEAVYRRMRAGERHSTAQAANHERHQRYAAALERFERVLYLAVGSAYTGNVAAARDWQRTNDPGQRLTILDTGAASGKLGLIALATARCASGATRAEAVHDFAEKAAALSGELVFLDKLKYLAAGGRMSKTGGWFGDLLKIKPVVSPGAQGAEKVAVVRRTADQLPLALDRLAETLADAGAPLLLLQYTDNRQRVAEEIQPALQSAFPGAEIVLVPLSLTAGVHMGPGTWSVAWLADSGGSLDGKTP